MIKYRIGIDFDNTIACYDQVFPVIAQELGFIAKTGDFTKAQVKKEILSTVDGDLNWQKLQGQIYGKYMNKAAFFPGFVEFLYLAKIRGHEVFVVSHKSPYGHFDEAKISLPEEAGKWLYANELVDANAWVLARKDIFFEPTRELKIDRIRELRCTHFIDDLQEVLDEAAFPADIIKYLFDPQKASVEESRNRKAGSWRSLLTEILGEWSEEEIAIASSAVFKTINVESAELKKGRGNSRIYQLSMSDKSKGALKIYPDRQLDDRSRLETEFSACNMLALLNFPVMRAIERNENMNWAVYSWIEGKPNSNVDEHFVNESVAFVKHLKKISGRKGGNVSFNNASEACLNGRDIFRQIEKRLARLKQIESVELTAFLTEEFIPLLESVNAYSQREESSDLFEVLLPADKYILSPSDFGAHNAIVDQEGKTTFIDFEYFGWDDPVKLVSDFYWHPGMVIPQELRQRWIALSKEIFYDDPSFERRLNTFLPLFGLRWCLILLNEFFPNMITQRMRADHTKDAFSNVQVIQAEQLKKAKKIISNIKSQHSVWTQNQNILEG
jgi:hypothetical protein